MSLKYLSNNLSDAAKLTSSSVNAQYPLSNIKDQRRTKTFRSNTNSDSVVIDLGTAESIDTFALIEDWKNGWGITSLTLEANATDSWSSPAYSASITLDLKYGFAYKSISPAQSYRFWRLVMTSTLGYCELSNLFLGVATTIETNGIGYNWSYVNNDLSTISNNRYGQQFSDEITHQKEIADISYQVMNKDEIDQIFEVVDIHGLTRPMFIYMDLETDGLINEHNRFNGMYYLKEMPVFTNISSGYYNVSMSLREAK